MMKVKSVVVLIAEMAIDDEADCSSVWNVERILLLVERNNR